MPPTSPFPIDAIYTWVDGDTPAFRANLAATRAAWHEPILPFSDEPHRFRDSGELRYSLRSLAAHAPWVRDVYVVTNGEFPPWLDTTAPGLHLVRHSDIIAPTNLPTFNSDAIALSLRNIPGLGDHIIHFNDDVFLGRAASPGYFFERNREPIVRVSPLSRINPGPGRGIAFTIGLLTQRFGPMPWPDIPHQPIASNRAADRFVRETSPGRG